MVHAAHRRAQAGAAAAPGAAGVVLKRALSSRARGRPGARCGCAVAQRAHVGRHQRAALRGSVSAATCGSTVTCGMAPERMLGSAAARLRTRRAPHGRAGRCRAPRSRSASTTCAPRARLTSAAPRGSAAKNARIEQAARGRRQRQQVDDDRRCRSGRATARRAMHVRHAGGRSRAAVARPGGDAVALLRQRARARQRPSAEPEHRHRHLVGAALRHAGATRRCAAGAA